MLTIDDYLDALKTLQERLKEAVQQRDLAWIDSIRSEYEFNLTAFRVAAIKEGAK